MTFADKAYDACAAKGAELGRRLSPEEWKVCVQAVYEAENSRSTPLTSLFGTLAPLSTTPEPEKSVKAKKMATDDEWLDSLEQEPALQGVAIRTELAKAQFWCKNNSRQCTRKFFENWLLKAPKTVMDTGGAAQRVAMDIYTEPKVDWRAVLVRLYPGLDPELVNCKPWHDLNPDTRKDILKAL